MSDILKGKARTRMRALRRVAPQLLRNASSFELHRWIRQ